MVFRISRLCRQERGTATIEYVMMMPFFILAMVIFWQFALAAYTFVVGESAAREAARAAALVEPRWGRNGPKRQWEKDVQDEAEDAAERVARNLLAEAEPVTAYLDTSDTPDLVKVTVKVKVPMMQARILENQKLIITRKAAMAVEP